MALLGLVVQATMRNIHRSKEVGEGCTPLPMLLHGLHRSNILFERRYHTVTDHSWGRKSLFANARGGALQHKLGTEPALLGETWALSELLGGGHRKHHPFLATPATQHESKKLVYHG